MANDIVSGMGARLGLPQVREAPGGRVVSAGERAHAAIDVPSVTPPGQSFAELAAGRTGTVSGAGRGVLSAEQRQRVEAELAGRDAVGAAVLAALGADARVGALAHELGELNADLTVLLQQLDGARPRAELEGAIDEVRDARRSTIGQLQEAMQADARARQLVQAHANALGAAGMSAEGIVALVAGLAPAEAAVELGARAHQNGPDAASRATGQGANGAS